MFYSKNIGVLEKSNGYVGSNGVWVDGGLKEVCFLECDIQPYNNELAYKQFGYSGKVSYKIYCDICKSLKLDGFISINGQLHKIVICKEWDDYMILVVVDKNDN